MEEMEKNTELLILNLFHSPELIEPKLFITVWGNTAINPPEPPISYFLLIIYTIKVPNALLCDYLIVIKRNNKL